MLEFAITSRHKSRDFKILTGDEPAWNQTRRQDVRVVQNHSFDVDLFGEEAINFRYIQVPRCLDSVTKHDIQSIIDGFRSFCLTIPGGNRPGRISEDTNGYVHSGDPIGIPLMGRDFSFRQVYYEVFNDPYYPRQEIARHNFHEQRLFVDSQMTPQVVQIYIEEALINLGYERHKVEIVESF